MQLKGYLQHLYDYNYWANKRYLAVAETLNEEQLFRKQGHSWDSVHAVLVHMMSSERMWPQRWRGEKGTFLTQRIFPPLHLFVIIGWRLRRTCAALSLNKQKSLSYAMSPTQTQKGRYSHCPYGRWSSSRPITTLITAASWRRCSP